MFAVNGGKDGGGNWDWGGRVNRVVFKCYFKVGEIIVWANAKTYKSISLVVPRTKYNSKCLTHSSYSTKVI